MGNYEKPYILGEVQQVNFPEGAYVVADADALAELGATFSGRRELDVRQIAVGLNEQIPDEVVRKASIVVVHADPSSPRSMQRIADLRHRRPFMPLIVALRDADLVLTRSLIRQGVNDVVTLPFDYQQLSDALLDASVGAEKAAESGVPLAPLYTVLASSGGCGATTIAIHLAAELARRQSGCCLVDMDIQFGTVAQYLGLSQARSVADLLEAGSRLDADLIESVSSDVREGLQLIAAPQEILPLEDIDTDLVLQVLNCTRRTYGNVVLDLPVNFTNWSMTAILDSSCVLMVVELTITSLRQARRRIDLLTDMGLDRRKLRVVANRVERRLFKSIKLSDAEAALGVSVIGSISNEPAAIGSAQDQGLLADDVQPRNSFTKDIGKLLDTLSYLEAER